MSVSQASEPSAADHAGTACRDECHQQL